MTEEKRLNNRYQIEEMLGSGGMAVVYRAVDLMLERPVAIKILRQNFSDDSEFRERFRQEARAAANLSHPNIVTVYDYGISDGHPFMVMEYIPGQHLKRMIQQQGRFAVEEAIKLMVQACAGIGYAHRAGIVHCDVKPHNLVVTPDLHLKVTDFGIARALSTIQTDERAELVWGSPQYFSPEQAAGSPPLPTSDVYSLGVVFYELLTGTLPYQAASSAELAHLHQTAMPISPRSLNPEISPDLEKIVLRMLAKEPAARYRTADQLGHVLESVTGNNNDTHASELPGETVIFETSQPVESIPRSPYWETPRPAHEQPNHSAQLQLPIQEKKNQIEFDWKTILLGLLATIAVGGLIPFWLWVYLTIRTALP